MTAERQYEIRETPQEVAEAAAELFAQTAEVAIRQHGAFYVALSGGSTPKLLYRVLSEGEYGSKIDWNSVQVFFSDERFVPSESEESNFHTAQVGLLSKVPIPEANIHSVPTVGTEPAAAAQSYEKTIREVIPGDSVPAFDLIFLGMGPDGHTASLFPDTAALDVRDRLVAANFVPKLDSWRITFTYPLLDAGRTVAFLVAGPDKSGPTAEIAAGKDYPAGRVHPTSGPALWFLDAPAASGLQR